MKKRLIGTLLMGALFVSSTSVFVSCKDYDDDINNIVATKADKTALEQAQKALNDEISSLKAQLESVNGQITALTNNKADKTEVEAVWAKLNPLLEKASNLETRIGEAESAIESIKALLGKELTGDLAGKTYSEALEFVWAKTVAASTSAAEALTRIEALENALNDPTTGLKAVVTDLKGQVEALNAYKARVEAIEADYLKAADKTELLNKITALQNDLTGKISDLESKLTTAIATAQAQATKDAYDQAKAYADQELEKVGVTIEGLRTNMQELTTKIDDTAALVNTLNVYVRSLLRGLVFQMESFYAGIEATDITVLNYRIYKNVPDADADKMEARGYTGDDFKADVAADFAESDANRKSHDYDPLDVTTRYQHKDTTRVLTFQAKYYMNPSTAAVDADSKVRVVAFDRPYHSGLNTQGAAVGDTAIYTNEFNGKTTDYCANIKPLSWKTEEGMLIVDYDANPEFIRTIRNDQAVTMFATQVAVNKEGLDTLITSDFATLYKKVVKDIVISHTPSTSLAGIHNGASYATHPADSVNTHCGKCAYNHSNPAIQAEYAAGLHLMQTVAEAAGQGAHGSKFADQFNCQDMVYWNDSLDLSKLVEIHYTTEGGDHTILTPKDAAYNGLHFKYELTGLYYGKNVTSESAHAAIKDSLFRPQMPDSVIENGVWVGKAAPWDNNGTVKGVVGKQDRQTIGRTPLVRVELLDKDNNIIDYGYIRIRITERPGVVPTVLPKTYTYNAGEMSAAEAWCGDNTASPFTFKQKWIQMEYDIHHDLDLSQAEFEKYYVADAAGGEFQQYYITANNTYEKVVAAPSKNEKLGVISYKRESADETTTVIEWDVTANQLLTYLQHCGTNPGKVVRLVKFANPTGYKGLPDVYVAIVASPLTVKAANMPTATINWDGRKILNYWYAKDSQVERSGLTEVHANVYGVEDEKEARAYTFKQTIQAAFVGNKIADLTDDTDIKSFITITNGPADVYDNLHLALKFVLGANTEFKGYLNGVEKTFVCVLKDKNRQLNVYRKDDPTKAEQVVARLIYGDASDSLNVVDVRYQHTDYAEAMLNYRRHNALNDDVLTAYVAVTARYKDCPFFVSDPINVRFLRPINVENNDKEVEDAAVNEKQIIYLRDLVKLSDWREQAFKTNYWYYYNIKSIEVIGVSKNGGTFDQNENIVTNMHQAVDSEPATSLKEVSKLVEFKYYGTNPGSTYNYTDANTSTTMGDAVPDLIQTAIPGLADYGCIVYTNLGSNVQKFKVRVPIKVVYQWGNNQGAIFTTVDINVKKTHENARQN